MSGTINPQSIGTPQSTCKQLKDGQHPRKHTPIPGQHDAGSDDDHTSAGWNLLCSGLPLSADFSQVIAPRWAVLCTAKPHSESTQ
jgi:hypothetical protein